MSGSLIEALQHQETRPQYDNDTRETLVTPSIKKKKFNTIDASHTSNWISPIMFYLKSNEHPLNKVEAKKIR